jgi:hypothetical protein
MDKPERHVSMIGFTAMGTQLVSAPTALALIKMVIADYYGPEELAAREPMKVEDGGAVWKMTGSRPRERYGRGEIEADVSKLNATILRLTI